MNQLGFGGQPVPGSLLTPDPASETAALEQARAEEARAEADERAARLGPGSVEEQREVLAGSPDAGRPKDITD